MLNNNCFISYRRATSAFVARAVFQDLRAHDIDAFLDVEAIDEGDFRKVIETQIRERPYFLPVFSPAALQRCRKAGDLMCREIETAVVAARRIVPLVTMDFDRKEILQCLPEPLAVTIEALNTVTVDHEYFEASMDKLRKRFLKAVAAPVARIDPVLARDANRLAQAAIAQPFVGPAALGAQKHFERAFAAAATRPELAAAEFGMGSDMLKGADASKSLLEDFNLAYLELQVHMQRENADFARLSNIMRAKHDEAKVAISSIR